MSDIMDETMEECVESPKVESPKVESPESELEMPPCSQEVGAKASENYEVSKLSPKDSSALNLIIVCLICFAVVSFLGALALPDERTALITGLVDTLKYVITASLGYLFATSTNHKN